MIYRLNPPVAIGDFDHQILVDQLEVKSISITPDPAAPVLSVVLVHRASGWTHNVVYTDQTAIDFWNQLEGTLPALEAIAIPAPGAPVPVAPPPAPGQVSSAIFAKLTGDKKLPPGDASAN